MMSDSVAAFIEKLATSISGTLSQLTSTKVNHRMALQEELPGAEIWANAAMSGRPSHRLAFLASTRTGLFLARALLSEPVGEATQLTAEDKELLTEFWKQAMGRATTDLRPVLESSSIDYADEREPDWQAALSAVLHFESEKGDSVDLGLRLSMEMVRSLTQPESSPAPVSPDAVNNLDLLMEVALAVSLRFGQRRMPLREILQLSSGSVIELDRQAEEAVDLLLDERLIARGQVVVVDGCYGLRVTEVCR